MYYLGRYSLNTIHEIMKTVDQCSNQIHGNNKVIILINSNTHIKLPKLFKVSFKLI